MVPTWLVRPGLPHRRQSGGLVYPAHTGREARYTPPAKQRGHVYPIGASREATSTPLALVWRPVLPCLHG